MTITWDPNKMGPDLTLSNGNLTVQRTSGNDWEQVLATVGKSSGKWYWEVVCDVGSSGYYSVVGVQDGDANFEYHTGQYEVGVESIGYMDNSRFYRSANSGYLGTNSGFSANYTVQIALDMDNSKIWFGTNGVWRGVSGDSPDPGTGTDPVYSSLSGPLYPAATVYNSLAKLIGAFFVDHCRFVPPSGFSYIDEADSEYTSTIWHPGFADDDIVLSADKKSVSHGGGSSAWIDAISNTRRTSGKYYFEVEAIALSDGFLCSGISDGAFSGHEYKYMGVGRFYEDGTFKAANATFTEGDVIGVAIDIDGGNIWWSKNNTWIGCSGATNPNPATGTDPIYTGISFIQIVAFVEIYNTSTEAKGFFSASELAYSPPTGFSALDSGSVPTTYEPDIPSEAVSFGEAVGHHFSVKTVGASAGISFEEVLQALWGQTVATMGLDDTFGHNTERDIGASTGFRLGETGAAVKADVTTVLALTSLGINGGAGIVSEISHPSTSGLRVGNTAGAFLAVVKNGPAASGLGFGEAAGAFKADVTSTGATSGLGLTEETARINDVYEVGVDIGFGLTGAPGRLAELFASVSESIGLGEIADPLRDLNNLGSSHEIAFGMTAGALNYSAWLRLNRERIVYRYYARISGAGDGLSDYDLDGLKSIQIRMRSGAPSYLSVVLPYYVGVVTAISARPNGEIIVDQAAFIGGVESVREELLRVDFDSIRYDRGAKNQSITLTGYRTHEFGVGAITLADTTVETMDTDGTMRFRCATPDFYLKPGYTVKYGVHTITVDAVTYTISPQSQSMEVSE